MFIRVGGCNHGIYLRRGTADFGPTVVESGLTLQGEWRQGFLNVSCKGNLSLCLCLSLSLSISVCLSVSYTDTEREIRQTVKMSF